MANHRVLVEELLLLWRGSKSVTTNPRHHVLTRVLYGLALQVASATQASLILVDAGHARDSMPVVRKAFEFAVIAQWLTAKGEAGLAAFQYESLRNTRQLLQSVLKVEIDVPEDIRQFLKSELVPRTSEADMIRHFEQVCRAFGDEWLYAIYRALSKECHPSVEAITMMFDDMASPVGRRGDDVDNREIVMYICALSLLWAMRAADERRKTKPWKGPLSSIGQRLGAMPLMPLQATPSSE